LARYNADMKSPPMPPQLNRWTADQLAALGYRPGFKPEPLLVEASNRRFFRIHTRASGQAATTLVVMYSPPEKENNEQFIRLAEVFAANGIGVPQIIAKATEPGFFLLSDLGRQHFADAYAGADRNLALAEGIDTLIRIQAIPSTAVPRYEPQRFRDELQIFRDWFVEGWLAEAFPSHDLEEPFEELVTITQNQLQCVVHRDFHCRNLLFERANDPGRRVGVVDFQDALMGPVSYDLASLLRDCYYRFPEAEIARWRDYYLQRSPLSISADRFAADLDLTAVQRQLKAVGIFARLQLRDGKSTHLPHIAPVLAQLQDLAARYPQLLPLQGHLRRWRELQAARSGGNP